MCLVKLALLVCLALPMFTSAEEEKCSVDSAIDVENQLKGMWQAWMIATSVRFDIAEHLRSGPLTTEELAQKTHTNAKALFRLMRALKFFKVFKQDPDGKWANTQVSMHLTNDEDCGLKHTANLVVRDEFAIWPNLYKVIQTNKPILPRLYGEPYWQFLSKHPERYDSLRNAAGELVRVFCKDIPKVFDFTKYKTIVDITGNDGTFLTTILKASPNSNGIVQDYEYQRKDAETYFKEHGVADRAKFVGGSFLDSVPEGGDLYIMKQSFHDWLDPQAIKFLKNVAAQMRKHPAKLLIINQFLPTDDSSIPAHVWDIYTFMMVGGKERTRAEYEALFKKAGLRLENVIPTQGTIPDIMEIVLDK